MHKVSGVKRKRVDQDWEDYGPIGPVEQEEMGASPWSNVDSYSGRNAQARSEMSSESSSSSFSMPSLATTETESSDSDTREGSSGMSDLRMSLHYMVVNESDLSDPLVDDDQEDITSSGSGANLSNEE